MKSVVSALLVGAVGAANASLIEDWEAFKTMFGKEYRDATEEMYRLKVFLENAVLFQKQQAMDSSATYSHLSKFADLTREEFKVRLGLRTETWDEQAHIRRGNMLELSTKGLPDSWDWRDKGAVNAVKDQGQCGSCWAFGTVANTEGSVVVQSGGELLSLSEQELVDCSKADMGCNGGLPERAYEDMIDGKMGLELEDAYPYHSGTDGSAGKCVFEEKNEKILIAGWQPVSQNEDQILAAVYKYGPLAIGLNASSLQSYTGGIFDPWFCNPLGIDHAVTMIGWGEESGKMHWLVRNSWGKDWGISGNFKIRRGKGKCGLNRMVTTAIADSSLLLPGSSYSGNADEGVVEEITKIIV